jgi:hypothetical protein
MDDERGLFQPLEIWNGGNETTAAAGEQPLDVLENMWGVAFVAGLTNATKMFYRDALASAREVLQRKMSEPEDDKDLREDFVSLAAETRWRITIQNSRSFRATFPDKQRGRSGFGDSLELAYRTMPLPLLVYVCEFCDFDTTITDRPLVHGEILLDPTSPAFANADRLLTVRTYEFLFSGKGKNYLSPEEIDNKYFVRPILDRPHGPICR